MFVVIVLLCFFEDNSSMFCRKNFSVFYNVVFMMFALRFTDVQRCYWGEACLFFFRMFFIPSNIIYIYNGVFNPCIVRILSYIFIILYCLFTYLNVLLCIVSIARSLSPLILF